MAEAIKQYRPLATTEDDADEALSVRLVRDLCDGINNAKLRACAPKLLSYAWPGGESKSITTTERLWKPFAPRIVPHGFVKVTWTAVVELGAANEVTLRLYAAPVPYQPVEVVTGSEITALGKSELIKPFYHSAALVFDATGPERKTSTTLFPARSADNEVYFFLTAKATSTTTTTKIYSLDATAGTFEA